MPLYRFTEILNDLVDYFILADPYRLLDYKNEHHLPDDLVTEFTTQATGDQVVEEGIMIPLAQVNNYPYTIYFHVSPESPELLKAGNELQLRQDGYILEVTHGRIYLFTIPYLRAYTTAIISRLETLQRAGIPLSNGWYTVSVLGGQIKQQVMITNQEGKEVAVDSLEPCFEFLISPAPEGKPVYNGDINYAFAIDSDEY